MRRRISAASGCIVAAAALIALFSGATSGAARAAILIEPSAQIDVELAFDTTASMRPSIAQAKQNGASIVARVSEAFPGARFAVVSFRDYGNASGDHELLQPMTDDIDALQAAFTRLKVASNSSSFNTPAEEYNLLFWKSYKDAAINWRPEARKVVVVVGDAQPHGAGASGITGCTDTSNDHYGLRTADVLEGMRAAQRTLVMIRQVSSETTASLECYKAMAERAYVGGAARNGDDVDVSAPILALVESAVAPVTLRPDIGVALPGGTAGYTATISNPNTFTLRLRSLDVTFPAGFRYRSGSSLGGMSSDAGAGTRVRWQLERILRPGERVSSYFRTTTPKRGGRFAAQAVVRLELPGGHTIASTGNRVLRVSPALRSLVVAARARRALQPLGTVSLRGTLRIGFKPRARALTAPRLLGGRVILSNGLRRSIVFRVRSYRIAAFGSPTRVRLGLEVERVRGMSACSPRARGSAIFLDDQRFGAAGLRRDTIVTRFGANCRIATGRWSNAGNGGDQRATVTTTAR
jgi:hypothetical protein